MMKRRQENASTVKTLMDCLVESNDTQALREKVFVNILTAEPFRPKLPNIAEVEEKESSSCESTAPNTPSRRPSTVDVGTQTEFVVVIPATSVSRPPAPPPSPVVEAIIPAKKADKKVDVPRRSARERPPVSYVSLPLK